MSPLESLGINGGYLAIQIIAFIVIYTLLSRFIYDPLAKALRERRERIAQGLEDAAAAESARKNAEAERDNILREARAEAAKIIDDARSRGEEVAAQIEAEARADADKLRADARAEASQQLEQQLAGLRGQVAQISVAMARQLINTEIDSKRQQALVSEFFSKVPAAAKGMSGKVEVVSAMPLDDKEKDQVRKQLGADEVTFIVDPSILGGLVVRGQDRVIDGSVRSGLSEMAASLN
ncbi:MAG: ATP synthase F0 subunit B [Chloroflexi bacterium]|nr:MAG: ATP synthase F0 subunit B [Phototrophicales bacterium]RMF79422.1 MAG: ATP synthase F0 subunit B [Chloroflexota bacterium]